MFEDLEDFALFGAALASHEVTDLEGYEIWRRSPSSLCR